MLICCERNIKKNNIIYKYGIFFNQTYHTAIEHLNQTL